MQCYDCAVENQTNTAVAVCSTCGAGLCIQHAVLGHADEWAASVGNQTAVRLAGRRILCQTCSASGARAESSATAGSIVSAPDA
ncbi:MAG TPA: DUF2180 family protein [Friedmanniella sp.]